MGKTWNGVEYNMDFEPISPTGEVIGPKDMGASDGWTNANEPWRNSPGWHAQPLSAEQETGLQAADPQAFAERQTWRAANPTNAIGAPLPGKSYGAIQPWQGLLTPASNGGGASSNPIGGGDQNFIEPWLMSLAPASASQSMIFQDALYHPQATDVGEESLAAPVDLRSSETGPRRRAIAPEADGDQSIDVGGGGLEALLALLAQGAIPSALR
jgi:hypothetical protein